MSLMQVNVTHVAARQCLKCASKPPFSSTKRAWLAYKISTSQPTAFGFRSFGLIAIHEIFVAVRTIETVEKFFGNVD